MNRVDCGHANVSTLAHRMRYETDKGDRDDLKLIEFFWRKQAFVMHATNALAVELIIIARMAVMIKKVLAFLCRDAYFM
ncbi:hypothetical protein O9929_13420 [Vibrio lentus]|nr:hypothetical protein [Vibrio lentus]